MRRIDQKIVVVTRGTRLGEVLARMYTTSHAKFVHRRSLENVASTRGESVKAAAAAADAEFAEMEAEHATYEAAVGQLLSKLDMGVQVQRMDRSFLPNYVFGPNDVVVTIGQDGLVANTAKYALGLPIVAVNPDPSRIDGILLPFPLEKARPAVQRALEGRARLREVTLAMAQLNNGQKLLAFNDFFIGRRSHVSARYRIKLGTRSEEQSSSGILISTGAGSTGWLSSVFNMASGVAGLSGAPAGALSPVRMEWEDPRLAYVVREPFISRSSRAGIVAGILGAGEDIVVESMMGSEGVIFSDGIESDYLAFGTGTVAAITAARERAKLVVG